MLVLGVSPVADRPQTVERGRVEAGEVPVRGASHTRLVEGEPELPSDPLGCEPEARLRAVRAIGGRPNDPGDPERAASCTGARPADRGLDPPAILLRAHPDVDRGAGGRRDHVRAEPAVDGADVDGDPAVGIVEREEALDLVRELEDRAHALAGADAGMGGPPFTASVNRPAPLRSVFSFPLGPKPARGRTRGRRARARRRRGARSRGCRSPRR